MKKVFCINCGKKFQFRLAPPKFCSGCGTNLETGALGKASESPSDESDGASLADDGHGFSLERIEQLKKSNLGKASLSMVGKGDSELGSIEKLVPIKNQRNKRN